MQVLLCAGMRSFVLLSLVSSVSVLFLNDTHAGVEDPFLPNPVTRVEGKAHGGPAGRNRPPRLDPVGSRIGSEGERLEFTICATDPDPDDTLTFSARNLPEGAFFDPSEATFSWTPGSGQAGTYEDVVFSVRDDGEPSRSTAERVTLTIGTSLNTYVLHPLVNVYSHLPDTGPTVVRDPHAEVTVVNTFYRSVPYLKFDLSPIPDAERVRSALLSLYEIGDWYGLPDPIELFYASNDEWNETTLYEDLPRKTGGRICRSSYPAGWSDWQEWDLSGHDFSWDLRDDFLTLILESNVHGSWRGTRFHGRTRTGDPARWPRLVITTVEGLPGNRPPRLDRIGNRTGREGELLRFKVSAADPDPDDTLTFTAGNLPEGATFHGPTATFSWVPGYDQAGNYENIEFAVRDGGSPIEVDAELVTITIGDVNRPPVFAPVGPREVLEQESVSFRVEAKDPDGDEATLSYGLDPDTVSCAQGQRGGRCVAYVREHFGGSHDSMPPLCGINPDCSAYNAWGHWDFGFGSGRTPAANSILVLDRGVLPDGHVAIVLRARDNRDGTFSLLVHESNWDRDRRMDCNVHYTYHARSSQVTRGKSRTRYPALGFIYGQLSENVTFDGLSGLFHFSPDHTQAGNYTVSFYATDDGEPSETARLEVGITVGDVPTLAERVDALVDAVEALGLARAAENDLLVDLKTVRAFIEDGRIGAAIQRLDSFVGRLEGDATDDGLGKAVGSDLVARAGDLIAALGR